MGDDLTFGRSQSGDVIFTGSIPVNDLGADACSWGAITPGERASKQWTAERRAIVQASPVGIASCAS